MKSWQEVFLDDINNAKNRLEEVKARKNNLQLEYQQLEIQEELLNKIITERQEILDNDKAKE